MRTPCLHDHSALQFPALIYFLTLQASISTAPLSGADAASHLPEHIQERLNQIPQLQGKQVLGYPAMPA